MSGLKYKNLFKPVSIAGTLFKNRMIVAAMGYLDVIGNRETGYYHKDDAAAFYERRAIGGAGAVTVGSCYIDRKYGDFGDHHVFLDDPQSLFSFYNIAHSITRHSAVASAEIIHCGLYSNRATGEFSYGPVAMEDEGRPVYEMDEAFILGLIDKFSDAALFAKKCGFNMVTVHGAHGWLLSQFANPNLNTRTDKWGGAPIENRARLAVSICKAIRAKVGPGFPIEIRISGSECYEGGYDIEEGIALAKQLDGHADLIHVSAGSHERDEVFTITHPDMFRKEGCNSVFAAEIKKNVKKSKIVTVGGYSDPELMEEIIATGKADFIALARSLLSDPDLPNKLRVGQEESMIKCMRCLSCFSTVQTYGKFYCSINPKTGNEMAEKYLIPAPSKKNVLIIGGGVGGMQAALTCAERGHEVLLCEQSTRLGGVLRCEERVPFKQNLARYLDAQERAVTDDPLIMLRLGTKVTPAMAADSDAEVIIAALGARSIVPSIKGVTSSDGVQRKNTITAERAYFAPEQIGEKAVIIGAGLAGVELGIFLSQLGKKVTIVEMLSSLNHGGNHLHAKGLVVQINDLGIEMNYDTKALEITDSGLIAATKNGNKLFEADTIVFAAGQSPLHKEAMAFFECAPEFHVLGDCTAPKTIFSATSAAYAIARSL